nr:hypothetical protein [Rhizobiaceae bacterium]
MVVMSDGENFASKNPTVVGPWGDDYKGSPNVSDYTAYGFVRYGRISPDDKFETFTDAVNAKTKLVCDNAKAAGIEIYTVLFRSTDAQAEATLKDCASSGKHFYYAVDAEALETTFSGIAGSLGQYRLVR